jgi:hypothetical protein
MARDLEISNSINLNGCKEFNHLRIINLNQFLSEYKNNLDYYKSPYAILADLENQIKFENKPEQNILISYKDSGDIFFKYEGFYIDDFIRVVEYVYIGTVS